MLISTDRKCLPSHVSGDEGVIVKYMQLCALFPPLTLLCERKRYEVMSEITTDVHFTPIGIRDTRTVFTLCSKDTNAQVHRGGITHFFMPFSRVSRTSVEASLTYVLVDVPLIPDASLRLDRLDCSGTDKCATKKTRFSLNTPMIYYLFG